ncbi:MAG: DNA mismatch repair protein MutS [Euryarchaeota archaeon]|nr:DNA mismatch repair protein MutS [Euryarchaeota archaeon]
MPEPSPMMAQYQGVKDRYPGHLVLFRVGDFYETFGEDAHTLSKEVEVTLTSRQLDPQGQRIPLAGVPYHSVEGYLAKLVRRGYRVVVVDQVEDAKQAKGLVRREVTRVVTPGTVLEETLLPRGGNNFLCAWSSGGGHPWCAALVDISTGETFLRRRPAGEARQLFEDLAPSQPVELLLPKEATQGKDPLESLAIATLPGSRRAEAPSPLRVEELPLPWQNESARAPDVAEALGRAAAYAKATEPRILPFLSPPVWRRPEERLGIDLKTLRHLEITEPMNPGPERSLTLLEVLNEAQTPPGRRTVEAWVRSPLADVRAIEERLDAVESLFTQRATLLTLTARLKGVGDISRLTARLVARRGGPRELLGLARSLSALPELRALLRSAQQAGSLPPLLQRVLEELDPREEFAQRLGSAVRPDAPAHARDGGVLRSEAFPELQALREVEHRARGALAELEQREAQATGIKSLKIGYTQVFGYYFEVTRAHLTKVPEGRWRRKQTLAGSERFTSDELAHWEAEVLQAEDRSRLLEARLYEDLLREVDREASHLQSTSEALGALDALANFARVALERRWVRPRVHEGGRLRVREGRHPILERTLGPGYVPNDVELDASEEGPRLLLLTGPNMAGKSTYMRQVGLLVVLAQAGSFVPARYAEVGRVSSLHTRMGFTDDIGRGKSSFMVEMGEVAEILTHSDGRSLVLLDEVGRGTSTSDGLALAWGVVRYLHDKVGARALVATHYHDLIHLVEGLPAARNAHLAVREERGEITFLRTLLAGGTEKSYGVHVAQLAGVPAPVLEEARRMLRAPRPARTEASSPSRTSRGAGPANPPPKYTQGIFLEDPEVERARELLREVNALHVERMTPVEALNLLHQLWKRAHREPSHPDAPPSID